jgi:hypothetical protein
MQRGIDPEKHFARVLYTKHQAIQMQVTAGQLDAGPTTTATVDAMIAQGLIKAERSKIIWQSAPLPNDALAVSAVLAKETAFVKRFQALWPRLARLLKTPTSVAASQLHRLRQCPRQRRSTSPFGMPAWLPANWGQMRRACSL